MFQKSSQIVDQKSGYRGVTKNGDKWQVIHAQNCKKIYLGSFSDKMTAAMFSDIWEIQNKGLKAQTNFKFRVNEVLAILSIRNVSKISKKNKCVRR